MNSPDLPLHYRTTLRSLVRFAAVMSVVALLTGVLFQESSKKVSMDLEPGFRLSATLRLALVHGHVFMTSVLIPMAAAGALLIARRIGGRELSARTLKWLTRVYLPFVCLALLMMLIKAYQLLLAVRAGETDFAAINERFFFGSQAWRHALYGMVHLAMATGLCVFFIALWRSLSTKSMQTDRSS
jgi:hypothetical protein